MSRLNPVDHARRILHGATFTLISLVPTFAIADQTYLWGAKAVDAESHLPIAGVNVTFTLTDGNAGSAEVKKCVTDTSGMCTVETVAKGWLLSPSTSSASVAQKTDGYLPEFGATWEYVNSSSRVLHMNMHKVPDAEMEARQQNFVKSVWDRHPFSPKEKLTIFGLEVGKTLDLKVCNKVGGIIQPASGNEICMGEDSNIKKHGKLTFRELHFPRAQVPSWSTATR